MGTAHMLTSMAVVSQCSLVFGGMHKCIFEEYTTPSYEYAIVNEDGGDIDGEMRIG